MFDLKTILDFITLTGLEIILGVDNVIFIALIVSRLPQEFRDKVRTLGLSLALIMRIGLLLIASSIMKFTKPIFTIINHIISGRNLLLILGGLFLIVKIISELRSMFKESKLSNNSKISYSFSYAIIQIISIDLVLSFDSIITAVGISNNIPIMIGAIAIAMSVMLISSKSIGKFIENNSSIKTLALLFIGLIGIFLILDGLLIHINKNYLYFALFFAILNETLNLILRKKNHG